MPAIYFSGPGQRLGCSGSVCHLVQTFFSPVTVRQDAVPMACRIFHQHHLLSGCPKTLCVAFTVLRASDTIVVLAVRAHIIELSINIVKIYDHICKSSPPQLFKSTASNEHSECFSFHIITCFLKECSIWCTF